MSGQGEGGEGVGTAAPPPVAASAAAGGSNRDGRAGRPRVQQLRPTNRDVVPSNGTSSSAPTAVAQAPVPARSDGAGQASTGSGGARVVPRIVTGHGSGSTIVVNTCQKGNPILKAIKNVGWEYGDIVPDYQVGVASCALFLSLRYHRLHPEYVHKRIEKMAGMFTLRVLLVFCDVDQPEAAIKDLTKVALVNNMTVMVAWSNEEVASYLERYKTFENKAPDMIRERVNDDYMSQLTSALTSVRGVNKTDVITLATNFGSFGNIAAASADELGQCPGFGDVKIRRLVDAFAQPFRVGETRTGRERRAERERLQQRSSAMEATSRSEAASTANTNAQSSSGVPATVAAGGLPPYARRPLPGIVGDDDDAERDAGPPVPPPLPQTSTVQAADAENEDDEFDDVLDDLDLTEEEQLQLALEMSKTVPDE